VFVRAAENFEFAGPAEIRDKTHMVLQSKREFVLGAPSVSDSDAYNEVFGEKIISFRQLLHRSSKAWTQFIPRTTDWAGNQMIFTLPIQRIPRPYGYTTLGADLAKGTIVPATDFGFNFCRVHPLTWIKSCFLGYKGSTNWTFNVMYHDYNGTTVESTFAVTSASVVRNPEAANNKPFAFSAAGTNTTSAMMKNFNTGALIDRQGATGMALTNQFTQAGLFVNLPYYSRFKFLINDNSSDYSLADADQCEKNLDWFEFNLKRPIAANSTSDLKMSIDVYVGTGPDFDVVFFINCPVYTYLPAPIAGTT
jgi:hypothetical protein